MGKEDGLDGYPPVHPFVINSLARRLFFVALMTCPLHDAAPFATLLARLWVAGA